MSEEGTPNAAPETAASDYVADVAFEDLALSEPVRRGIQDRGYLRPTPVQARAIPRALTGKDLIVRSKTGTGKTAAFGIPMLERLEAGARKPLAIVLCPTRELALQVAEEIAALGKHKDLRVAAIYGGASMKQQIDALEDGAEIIVGTPGRVYDHLRRRNLDLSQAQVAVLDEADEMLNQGFFEEVTRILEHLPDGRQMMLFSATVPPDIDRLIRRFCKDPESILISGDDLTVEGIENVLYYTVDAYPKPRNLIYALELEQPENAIVFCNTRDDTSLVTAVLNRNGFDAEVLNGDLPQPERERVMGRIKKGELAFLVATDIAARGIDISDLGYVINYSLPEDPAVYLHRVGRTGRIGKKGVAISLVGGREMVTLTALEKRYGIQFEERKLPTPEEARKQWADKHVAEIKQASANSVWEAMVPLAQDIQALPEGEQLFAFLLRYFFTHHRMDRAAQAQEVAQAAPREEKRRERPEPRERSERGRRDERERRRERPERATRPERDPRAASPEATAAPEAVAEAEAAPPPAPKAPPEGRPEPEAEADPRGARLWVNLGQADKLDEAGLAEGLAALAQVDRAQIRAAEVRLSHSFLYVDPAAVEKLIAATGQEREGKKVRVERPRPRR
jgi:ATP-dependent RNA helicase DeaD